MLKKQWVVQTKRQNSEKNQPNKAEISMPVTLLVKNLPIDPVIEKAKTKPKTSESVNIEYSG